MSGRARACAAIAFAIAVAGGCAPTAPSTARPTTSVVPAASGPATTSTPSEAAGVDPGGPLYGTYVATIPSGVNAAPGDWTLTADAGRWMFTHPDGHRFSPGAVKEITASEVILAADPECPVQSGTPTDGRYRWSVDGTSLTLQVISDSCQDRIDTLTSDTWSLTQ